MKQLWLWTVVAIALGVGTSFGQQAPPTGPVSLVAYVDILPASRAQAIDEFRRYRDASRQEAGYVSLDIYEQQRRGAYYAMVETWASAAAADAHAQDRKSTRLNSSH